MIIRIREIVVPVWITGEKGCLEHFIELIEF